MSEFVHLHTHSDHSLLDGLSHVGELVGKAKEMGMPAVGLTDHGTLSGAVPLAIEAERAGIKPIIGCEVYVAPRGMTDKEAGVDRDPFHLVLLAENDAGYQSLCHLVTKSHLEGFYYRPRIDHAILRDHSEGLICLSGCKGGEVAQALLAGDVREAERLARGYLGIFGDRYFLELQDHGAPDDITVNEGIRALSRKLGVPVVATGDSHYVRPEDSLAHEVLLCIQTGAKLEDEGRFKFEGSGYHLSSDQEMRRLLGNEAVDNAGAVAAKCSFRPNFKEVFLPKAPLPGGVDANDMLAMRAGEGLTRRFGGAIPDDYSARLERELQVIQRTGFAPYFLIVSDFTDEARRRGIPVGPGRGSAAGSLVSYCLQITDIDPVRYGLVFERFLNEERLSMPDIDIDFEPHGRDQLVAYARERYGEGNVAQIATFGTMGARSAIRDVGRVLGIPQSYVDPIAKAIPGGVPLALMEFDGQFSRLVAQAPRGSELLDLARRLEGTQRNVGKHASGVVISPFPITNLMPLQQGTGDSTTVITQFDGRDIERMGLLKVDFLGLDNLTVIRDTLALAKAQKGGDLTSDEIPLDDAATFGLLSRADTVGVFQFDKPGGQRILREIQPRTLEDLAAANALNRPGPLAGRIQGGATIKDAFMARRHGREPVTYPTPECEQYLKGTEGLMLYQDQVMQVAAVVAGYSLGEADVLRAAMGKKDPAKMARQRLRFVSGAVGRGFAEEEATQLFETIETFAGYGFNKAHAMSYALVGYQTAYLKAHFPTEFTAALLNCKADDLEKVNTIIRDAEGHGIRVRPPSVQESAPMFSVSGPEEVRFGLAAIKRVGEGAARAIVNARLDGGLFRSLEDLVHRVPSGSCSMRDLEALVRSGACDRLGERNAMLAALPILKKEADRSTDSGPGLFGEDGGAALEVPTVEPMSGSERLQWERELCGSYLSGHPAAQAGARLWGLTTVACADAAKIKGTMGRVGGVVIDVTRKRTRTGKDMGFATIEDQTGACRLVIPPRSLQDAARALVPGNLVVAAGKIEGGGGQVSDDDEADTFEQVMTCVASRVLSIDDPEARSLRERSVAHIECPADVKVVNQIQELVSQNPGPLLVVVHPGKSAPAIPLPARTRIRGEADVIEQVRRLCGPASWRIEERQAMRSERRELAPALPRMVAHGSKPVAGGPRCPAR